MKELSREEILRNVRMALSGASTSRGAPSEVPLRYGAELDAEIALALSEVRRLGGVTHRIERPADFDTALRELVASEGVSKATLWQTQDLQELSVKDILVSSGVELISPYAGHRQVAGCDLGVTGVDIALPETGTLVLRSSPDRPRIVSLLPRIHLALLRPAALRADLYPALAEIKDDGAWVFVTGPSRTADIELTLTIGVHGPAALYVWSLEW